MVHEYWNYKIQKLLEIAALAAEMTILFNDHGATEYRKQEVRGDRYIYEVPIWEVDISWSVKDIALPEDCRIKTELVKIRQFNYISTLLIEYFMGLGIGHESKCILWCMVKE